ncbi:MAG: hypothetical protein WCG75_07650 [Armatimonadota bacterium]
MSDPKISPNKAVSIQDRLYIVGNASFICFVVAIIWTVLYIGKAQISTHTIMLLAAPCIATGSTVLIGSLLKEFVPKPSISLPLNFTVPIVWALVCYLAVMLLSTQETGATSVPEGLMPALVWAKLSNLVPVFCAQVAALSLVVFFTKDKE